MKPEQLPFEHLLFQSDISPSLQVIGRHRAPQAAPLARRLLGEPASSVMLIQASAAILAQCGGNNDLPLLQKQLATAPPSHPQGP
jgi:hypothetical protein